MKTAKLILLLVVACALAFASAAGARHRLVHKNYTGPGGCPSWIAPYSTGYCAYHTNIRRIVVKADGSHFAVVGNAYGQCTGNPCTAVTGYSSYEWNGQARIGNRTGSWLHVDSAWLYT